MANHNIDCCWDQRIPNESILERQFLITRPPIMLQSRPVQSSCPIKTKNDTGLLFNRKTEHRDAEYWKNNVITTEIKGIDTIGHTKPRSYRKLLKEYPDKPWLHGTSINIDKESELKSLNFYNTKDCIRVEAQHELTQLSRLNDETMMRNMQQQSTHMNNNGKLWNISTSARMIEPLAYETSLKNCSLGFYSSSTVLP